MYSLVEPLYRSPDTDGVFECREETRFYGTAVYCMCFPELSPSEVVVELGAGDGTAVIGAMKAQAQRPTVVSYEICRSAYREAKRNARQARLQDNYVIRYGDFFRYAHDQPGDWLIANPPYLPALDDELVLPSLWGGPHGNSVIKHLVGLGFPKLLMVVSSYSHPSDTLRAIRDAGYRVACWMGGPMPLGKYSTEEKVVRRLLFMRDAGTAFFSESDYRVTALMLDKEGRSDYSDAVFGFLSTA